MSGQAAPAAAHRLGALDATRGAALVAMAFYHLTWDIKHFRLIDVDLANSATFHGIGHAIASVFVGVAGFSLALAHRDGFNAPAFFKRLALIGGAAVAVTLVTFYAMPDAYIFFGILHCIAAASLAGALFLRAPLWLIGLVAALAIAAPHAWRSEAFNSPALAWIGFAARDPYTYDFRSFFPWFGVFLAGMAAARLGLDAFFARLPATAAPWRWLALGGRHSLAVYLVHQPVLFGALMLATMGASQVSYDERPFMAFCVEQCSAAGGPADLCQSACRCSIAGAKKSGLWRAILEEKLTSAQEAQLVEIAGQCRKIVEEAGPR